MMIKFTLHYTWSGSLSWYYILRNNKGGTWSEAMKDFLIHRLWMRRPKRTVISNRSLADRSADSPTQITGLISTGSAQPWPHWSVSEHNTFCRLWPGLTRKIMRRRQLLIKQSERAQRFDHTCHRLFHQGRCSLVRKKCITTSLSKKSRFARRNDCPFTE